MGGTLEKTAEGLRYRVDRGPNWLFVRLSSDESLSASRDLSEELWSICVRHFTYRLVLELNDVASISPETTRQLEKLRERLTAVDGALRLCGANDDCQQTLSGSHYAMNLKSHESRAAAVHG